MDDDRVWEFESSLWTGSAEHYRALIDDDCLMVLPSPPYIVGGEEAVAAVAATPRWTEVDLKERRIARPEEGLIAVAYQVAAQREAQHYRAYCTSTYRRRAHDDWQVVQHHQTPVID
jgi:hypothetical protein